MNRTEILNIIKGEQALSYDLSRIDNPTALSVMEQLNQLYARSGEILFDRLALAKNELQAIAESAPWATEQWYIDRAKAFRYGLELIVNQYTQYYYDNSGLSAEDIAAMQIVKQAAVEMNGRKLIVKVAGIDADGNLQPLGADLPEEEQLAIRSAFLQYMNQIKRPGTPIELYNFPADVLRIEYDIYYDGLQVQSRVESDCRTAIDNYLKTIVFNGFFSVTELTDVLQKVKGVRDPYFKTALHKRYFDTDFQPVDRRIRAYSGYYVLENVQLNMYTQ